MKTTVRRLFAPLLKPLESGDHAYEYRSSHRTILITVGALFTVLAAITVAAALVTGELAAAIPLIVFLSIAVVCLVVGTCGSERAVATLWRNRR